MDRTVPFLNACVSFVVFITALTLVFYMVISFATGVFDVVQLMRETVLLEPGDRQLLFKTLNVDFLHNVAILVILIKAYRILVEYMRYHHINLKFMVEITIIACVLELLFNYQYYTPDMRMVLAFLGVTFLGVYAFRYEVLLQSATNAQQRKVISDYNGPESKDDLRHTELATAGKPAKPKIKRRLSTKAK